MPGNTKRGGVYRSTFGVLMIIIGLLALAGYLLHRSVHTPFELRHASLTLAAGSSLRDFAVEVDRMGGSKGELPVLL